MAYEGPEIYRAPYASDKAYSNFERTVEDGFRPTEISELTDREFETDLVRM